MAPVGASIAASRFVRGKDRPRGWRDSNSGDFRHGLLRAKTLRTTVFQNAGSHSFEPMLSLRRRISLPISRLGQVMFWGRMGGRGPAPVGAGTGTQRCSWVSRERCAPVPVCGSTKMERFPQISWVLERNIVLGHCGSGLRTRLPASHFSPAFLPVIPRTEQDNVPSDNLCSIFLSAVLPVFPGRCLQFAFNNPDDHGRCERNEGRRFCIQVTIWIVAPLELQVDYETNKRLSASTLQRPVDRCGFLPCSGRRLPRWTVPG